MAVNFKGHLLVKKTLIKVFILYSLLIICGNAAKLTVPRILLPYNTGVPTNYTLEVKEGGCYKWYLISLIKELIRNVFIFCTSQVKVNNFYVNNNYNIIL